jgi:cell surface protein SprA
LQTVVYGFRPLIALDLSWEKIFGGHMTASLNYDTQTEWASDYSSQRINKRLSNTFGITANYSHQGVSIPFLKLNLKNEFGASFTVSYTNSADSYFTFDNIGTLPGGTGNGGLEKLTIEPRISYTVSQQLTLEGFYRYERTTPASSGQLAPPTRLIMAGIDIRLKIQ